MRLLLPTLLLVSACKVVDAPDDFEELVVFGFTNFMDEPELPVAAAEGLIPYAETIVDELEEGFRVDNLTYVDLVSAGVDPQDDEVDILGASARVLMTSDPVDIAWVLTYEDMTEVQEQVMEWDVTPDGDRDCFLAQQCETYSIAGSRTTSLGMFGESTQEFSKQWRWIELDGETLLSQRELSPHPAEMSGNLLEMDQQYGYSLFYVTNGGTWRLDTVWVDARMIGMDVPDTFALDQAVKAMKDNALYLDTFIAENR